MEDLLQSAAQHESLHFKADRRGTQRDVAKVRRRHERLFGSCQAIVRGVDREGTEFTEVTALDNVSARGLYIKLQHRMECDARLFVVFAFSTVALQDVKSPRVAVRGQIRRIEPLDE